MVRSIPLRLSLIFLGVAIVAAGCGGRARADDSLDRVRQGGVLRIATDPSYPPFSYLDGEGQPAGYDVELGRELARRLGAGATFVGIDIASVFDALVARKADVAVAAISPAWEHGKEIGFSRSYFNAGQVFMVRSGSRQITRPQDLESGTLGVEIGSAAELEARKMARAQPGLSLRPFESLEAGAAALSTGQLDALIADRVTAAVLTQNKRDLRIAGGPFTDEPYVMAARQSSRSLLKEIDAILGALAGDGFLQGLETRFLSP
ncbi:MAG: amino acid ABC transporter substrate-binding protein [Chloroflexi bacterium]|nr:amino acid ABC transporter substrate-binding protein [Chloroflexota bacterium]